MSEVPVVNVPTENVESNETETPVRVPTPSKTTILEDLQRQQSEEVPTETEEPGEEEVSEDTTEDITEETEEEVVEEEPKEGAFGLNVKAFKEKYPLAFKEFPTLRNAIYHGRQMLEVFPSIEDAKDARQKLEGVQVLENSIMSGDPSVLLGELFQFNPQVFDEFVNNIIPTIEKGSRELYAKVTWPVIHRVLRTAYDDGVTEGEGSQLKIAAMILHKHLTGKLDIAEKLERKTGISKEAQQLQRQQQEFYQHQKDQYMEEVYDQGEKQIKSRIAKGMDERVPENLRELLVEKIYDELSQHLESDTVHMAQMNALWRQVRNSGLDRGWKPKILNAYLGQAAKILPQIRQKHLSKLIGAKTSTAEKPQQRKHIPQSNSSPGVKRMDGSKIDWNRTSTLQALQGNVTLKK